MIAPDAYKHSVAFQKIHQAQKQSNPIRVAFIDIDGTWTGSPHIQQRLRDELEYQGYIIACVTNRSSNVCISSAAKHISSAATQKYIGDQEEDPSTLPHFTGLIDIDIIISAFGGEVFIKQMSGGYETDQVYMQNVPYESATWHSFAKDLLISTASKCEVLFLEHRVQLFFSNIKERDKFAHTFTQLQHQTPTPTLSVARIFDESDEHRIPPVFSIMLTQQYADKESAVNRTIEVLKNTDISNIHTIIAGDGAPDIPMGLRSAESTDVTFIIPGGARVTPYLLHNTAPSFLQEEYSSIKNNLILQNHKGWYRYAPNHRIVIIGDEAFPDTVGPETLLAWLKTSSLKL
jgi:hydroxymethylpyrimidine pyrophosphatase-like HAD family hydrolase